MLPKIIMLAEVFIPDGSFGQLSPKQIYMQIDIQIDRQID